MLGGGVNPGLNSGLGSANMNSDLTKQMPLLTAAGRRRVTSAAGQQQQQVMGVVPPGPPSIIKKQRAQFMSTLSQVLASKGLVLPPFVTGQPNPDWIPGTGPLKNVQPASDNRSGALRIPGAAPGRAGDIDLFRLWSAVTDAGGMRRVSILFRLAFRTHRARRSLQLDSGATSPLISGYNSRLRLVRLIGRSASSRSYTLYSCHPLKTT
jgi:hypothetical protein